MIISFNFGAKVCSVFGERQKLHPQPIKKRFITGYKGKGMNISLQMLSQSLPQVRFGIYPKYFTPGTQTPKTCMQGTISSLLVK